MGLLRCNNLNACDKYFEVLLANSVDFSLLGNIELTQNEVQHLADIISNEVQRAFFGVSNSLAIAVFLVWVGILYYQEGYFWPNVHEILKLPPYRQQQCQKTLGGIFLRTIEKHQLLQFEGGHRYVMPILAHGCVPNSYLDEYFCDVILAIYKEREQVGLSVNPEETKHLVANWRRAYFIYQKTKKQLGRLEEQEKLLLLVVDIQKNREKLEQLRELQNGLIKSTEVTELLSVPDDWLKLAEARRDGLKLQLKEFEKALETRTELNLKQFELNRDVERVAKKILKYWDDDLESLILAFSVDEIKNLVDELIKAERAFIGFWRRPSARFMLYRRYHRVVECKRRLQQKLNVLPFTGNLPLELLVKLPKVFSELQQLIIHRQSVQESLKQLEESELEAAAAVHGKAVYSEMGSFWEKQLFNLNKEIAACKKNLVRIGKGRLEAGLDELHQQRELRRRIENIKGAISAQHDIDTLVEKLSLLEHNSNSRKVMDDLVGIRSKKKELEERYRTGNDPLYFLKESTRIFIFQGGEMAEKFIFQSLLLMQKLDHRETDIESIVLPSRIVRAMGKWWHRQGKEMLAATRETREWSRGVTGLTFHRPIVKLDAGERSIKVELPRQIIKEPERTVLVIRDQHDVLETVEIPVKKVRDGHYHTDPVLFELQRPLPVYNFQLWCSDKLQTWQVKGLDADNICLFFSQQGELIEDTRLPEKGVYVVVPTGSSIKPAKAVREKERLAGYWSDYEYCYLDFDHVDMVLVEAQGQELIFKKQVQLVPQLVGGDEIPGVNVRDKPVYSRELPALVFSINTPEDISFYGIRLDYPEGSQYIMLSSLNIQLRKDKVVFVPLADIISGAYGLFKIALVYRQDIVWTDEFVLVPDLEIKFDQKLYSPKVDKQIQTGQLQLSSTHHFTLILSSHAELVKSTSFSKFIKFDIVHNQLDVELKYFVGLREYSVGVSIDIPVVQWRTNDTDDWKFEIGEIWHEDAGEMQVRLPYLVSPAIKLGLAQGEQVITPTVKRGIPIFNLRQFSDNLRESNLVLEDLVLYFHDGDIIPCLLAHMRLCWQVVGVELEQTQENENRKLIIKWQDVGKASDRVVRLWPLNMPETGMIERYIPDGVSQMEIVEPLEYLPVGFYRLQFAIDDPWAEAEIVPPEVHDENCKDIIIGDRDEILSDVLQNGLNIISFEYHNENIPNQGNYWIQDIEIYSEFEEEEEGFRGNVYTVDSEGRIIALDYNPVSFYLDLHTYHLTEVPFLVDRDKDGATYCRKCRMLFWEIAHRECGDQVILPEYIFVAVRREKVWD